MEVEFTGNGLLKVVETGARNGTTLGTDMWRPVIRDSELGELLKEGE